MDHEDSKESRRRGLDAGDPLPPEGWTRPARTATVAALYAEHRPQLARFFRRRAAPQDIADLVQEVFRRFISSRETARATVEQPGAYLARTAQNLLAERARSASRQRSTDHVGFDEDEHPGCDPVPALEARDAIRRVEAAIARLKPTTREIFLMHRFDALSYEEIAAARGMSVKGVEKQIAKALVAIRRARRS